MQAQRRGRQVMAMWLTHEPHLHPPHAAQVVVRGFHYDFPSVLVATDSQRHIMKTA